MSILLIWNRCEEGEKLIKEDASQWFFGSNFIHSPFVGHDHGAYLFTSGLLTICCDQCAKHFLYIMVLLTQLYP